jgi:hypothetical protein
MSLKAALLVVSRPCSISVASGAKRTLSRIFDLDARGVDRGVDYWERGAGPFASASPIDATRAARDVSS